LPDGARALAALREADFDWVQQLRSVWRDSAYHVEALNQSAVETLMREFKRRTRDADQEHRGAVIVGPPGAGKTHLLGTLRRMVWNDNGWFVLLDLIDVGKFWPAVCLAFVNSLHRKLPDGRLQYQAVLHQLAEKLAGDPLVVHLVDLLLKNTRPLDKYILDHFLGLLSKLSRDETLAHQDVLRAFLLLNSVEVETASTAYSWLQGLEIQPDMMRRFGFAAPHRDHRDIVRGLSWIMSLAGPTLLAVDQIDAIISEYNLRAGRTAKAGDDSERKARSIIEELAAGLMNLYEVTYRSMTLVSCIEDTWTILRDKSIGTAADRFDPPILLKPLGREETATLLVRNRLAPAYAAERFAPPYPTFPFRPEAFASAIDLSPRELLMKCDEHRRRCLAAGEISELDSFLTSVAEPPQEPPDLDPMFAAEKARAAIEPLLDPDREDELYCRLLLDMLRLYVRQSPVVAGIDAVVDGDLEQKRPALHGRLRYIYLRESGREEHFSFRAINHDNALAFQTRLKAAVTASGIDRDLPFRRLLVLRRAELPGGKVTAARVAELEAAGGHFIALADDELRSLLALQQMLQHAPDGLDAWLRQRRPLCAVSLFRAAGLCEAEVAAEADEQGAAAASAPPADADQPAIPLGSGQQVPLAMLTRHTAVLAGSGSGKTVLLRRLIEEAALLGVPSIVLDSNNDLARLGDPWPARPEPWSDADAEKADRYHRQSEVVIWTPLLADGNPLVLASLPAFASLADESDELDRAVRMAASTLTPFIGASGANGPLKQAILINALQHFARHTQGDLADLVRFLAELPAGISEINNAGRLSEQMADHLIAQMNINPLLSMPGTVLDPALLVTAANPDRTRVSVINLSGLVNEDARAAFVNQLQMALFSYIRAHPATPDRPLRALYVMDEAQNFAPAQRTTPCKESTLALVAQARKYGLGMVFATQVPRGIDNKIIANATTQLYGRMNAPATIEATRELMDAKGGAAGDLGRLRAGEFYFTTEGLARPVRIDAPLCLSHHPQNPLSLDEVVAHARLARAALPS
jgi:hypothetical protein